MKRTPPPKAAIPPPSSPTSPPIEPKTSPETTPQDAAHNDQPAQLVAAASPPATPPAASTSSPSKSPSSPSPSSTSSPGSSSPPTLTKLVDRTVVGRSTVGSHRGKRRSVPFTPSTPFTVTLISAHSLHHATLESAKEIVVVVSYQNEMYEAEPFKESKKRGVDFALGEYPCSHTFTIPEKLQQCSWHTRTNVTAATAAQHSHPPMSRIHTS